jgi:hypothetical protein
VQNRGLARNHYFPAYLTLVGLITSAAFVVARCGATGTIGYVLLSIFARWDLPPGICRSSAGQALKSAFIVCVAVWALSRAIVHARLWNEYLRNPPVGQKALLVDHLLQRGVRYGITDYWNAYYISFLTNERIIMQSTGFDRIR